mmetsp:Transcript_2623/g.4273  ORF Transcript_2623/g.4273 Transcript_2623/m.4273 type:complete len:255 (+) Transcript_2623:1823-2587(+)
MAIDTSSIRTCLNQTSMCFECRTQHFCQLYCTIRRQFLSMITHSNCPFPRLNGLRTNALSPTSVELTRLRSFIRAHGFAVKPPIGQLQRHLNDRVWRGAVLLEPIASKLGKLQESEVDVARHAFVVQQCLADQRAHSRRHMPAQLLRRVQPRQLGARRRREGVHQRHWLLRHVLEHGVGGGCVYDRVLAVRADRSVGKHHPAKHFVVPPRTTVASQHQRCQLVLCLRSRIVETNNVKCFLNGIQRGAIGRMWHE